MSPPTGPCGHGPQYDYFDHENRVGWTRPGDEEHPKAMAVLMSDGPEGMKWMDGGSVSVWVQE